MNAPPLSHASLILTYKCNVTCRHCEVCCGPTKGGLMPVEDAREYLTDLKKAGVQSENIEISGGEPFLYEDHVWELLYLVKEIYGPQRRIRLQTNGFWCTDDDIVQKKFKALKNYCVFVVSSVDFFHFEHLHRSRIRRSLNTAAEAFNMGDHPHFTSDLKDYTSHSRVCVSEAVEYEGIGLTGNAAFSLAPYLKGKPAETFKQETCADVLIDYDKIHIDPYGNVFPPCRCVGILLGNGNSSGIYSIIQDRVANGLVQILATSGPFGLLEKAISLGYDPLENGYVNKCHLCYRVRHFLFHNNHERDALGPVELYEPTADETSGSTIILKPETHCAD